MKLLQLCLKPPYPPVDGGTLAMNSITQGLLDAGHEVKVLAVSSDKHPVREKDIDPDYRNRTRFEAVHIDLHTSLHGAAAALITGKSYNVRRFESKAFAQRLAEILEEPFDVILFESIFLTPYLPLARSLSNARMVLRAHNVEHHIWQRLAKTCRVPVKRQYLLHLAHALRKYEMSHIHHYDGIVCITANDAATFRQAGYNKPVTDIPFSITPEPLENIATEQNSLFHIGSMDWLPNIEGVQWFLDKVWPSVHKRLPQFKLYLAGRKMPRRLIERHIDGVTVVGEVDDAMYFIASKSINIVPLLSGSGIRVKIIEAMSAGKTVVTTTIGAQGIDCEPGRHLLIADTPDQFVVQLQRLVDHPDLCNEIGNNAYNLINEKYNPEQLTQKLTNFLQKLT